MRQIPDGYAFNKIAVPNYTFESIAWLSFAVMTMDPIGKLSPSIPHQVRRHEAYRALSCIPRSTYLLDSGHVSNDGLG